MVTTEDEEILGILDLVGQEQADGLKGLLASVDVVTKEEVVGFRGETAIFEESKKIVILAVYVTTDLLGMLAVGESYALAARGDALESLPLWAPPTQAKWAAR